MEFSDKEQEIYDYIKEVGGVSVKDIQQKLGDKAVGGIGRLLKEEVIEKEKRRIGEGYNIKSVVYYKIKKDNNE